MELMRVRNCCTIVGDLVLVQGKRDKDADNIQMYRVAGVKTVDKDGEPDFEVILFPRKNIWFSWKQFLAGTSWVKDIQLVLP